MQRDGPFGPAATPEHHGILERRLQRVYVILTENAPTKLQGRLSERFSLVQCILFPQHPNERDPRPKRVDVVVAQILNLDLLGFAKMLLGILK